MPRIDAARAAGSHAAATVLVPHTFGPRNFVAVFSLDVQGAVDARGPPSSGVNDDNNAGAIEAGMANAFLGELMLFVPRTLFAAMQHDDASSANNATAAGELSTTSSRSEQHASRWFTMVSASAELQQLISRTPWGAEIAPATAMDASHEGTRGGDVSRRVATLQCLDSRMAGYLFRSLSRYGVLRMETGEVRLSPSTAALVLTPDGDPVLRMNMDSDLWLAVTQARNAASSTSRVVRSLTDVVERIVDQVTFVAAYDADGRVNPFFVALADMFAQRPTLRDVQSVFLLHDHIYVRAAGLYFLRYMLPSEEILPALTSIVSGRLQPAAGGRTPLTVVEDGGIVSATADGSTTLPLRELATSLLLEDEVHEAWVPTYWPRETARLREALPRIVHELQMQRQRATNAAAAHGGDAPRQVAEGPSNTAAGGGNKREREGDDTAAPIAATALPQWDAGPGAVRSAGSGVPGFRSLVDLTRFISSLPIVPAGAEVSAAADGGGAEGGTARFVVDRTLAAGAARLPAVARRSSSWIAAPMPVPMAQPSGKLKRPKRHVEAEGGAHGTTARMPQAARGSVVGSGTATAWQRMPIAAAVTRDVVLFAPQLTGDVMLDAPVMWAPAGELMQRLQTPASAMGGEALSKGSFVTSRAARANDGGWTLIF